MDATGHTPWIELGSIGVTWSHSLCTGASDGTIATDDGKEDRSAGLKPRKVAINMSNPNLPIHEWPQSLRHLLDRLERTTHDEYRETRMEDGSIRRTRLSSPTPAWKGEVWLSRAERDALEECAAASSHWRFDDPTDRKECYAAFVAAPVWRRSRLVAGSDSEFLVEILLRDTTEQVSTALKHV